MYKYDPDGERFIQDVAVGSNPTAIRNAPWTPTTPPATAQVLEEKDAGGVVTRTYTLGHDVIAQQAPGPQGGEPTIIGRFSTNSGMHRDASALADSGRSLSDLGSGGAGVNAQKVAEGWIDSTYRNDFRFGLLTYDTPEAHELAIKRLPPRQSRSKERLNP